MSEIKPIPAEDFIAKEVIAGHEVDIGIDDAGQEYYFQYTDEDGVRQEVGCGSYVMNYKEFIEYYFAPYYSYICKDCGHEWASKSKYKECVRCDSTNIEEVKED